ncbi:MAG: hypothetical protein GWM98_15455 [Nitrospinaceae bacterium]|nr:hypothetical protein [Nitrospinaceae bacterium]NIR55621.1 hypothetical protein [Nitrospinaceae bacterium]NIS86055.1 hypothetical protein [Nitrospinaceae bacterium]NIT82898.1 hypothetical protein [Nitrospinaceae bacterium]NIU45103.1 hypothetical protein [Nitrospinaceae bacterium]
MLKRFLSFILVALFALPGHAGAIKYKGDLETNESVTYPEQGSTPSNPASTKHKLYIKSDGDAYTLDSSGVEEPVTKGALEATESVILPEQGSTPANPAATKYKLYFKDDGGLYQLDSAGTEQRAAMTGFKNILVNGDFRIWQRGTSFAYNLSYGPDRWGKHNFQSGVRSRQTFTSGGDHPGNSEYVCRTAGDGTNSIRMQTHQGIESINTIPLRGKTVTVSGYIRFSAATITSSVDFRFVVGYTNAAADGSLDSSNYTADGAVIKTWTNGSYPTAWERFSATITVGSSANNVVVGGDFSAQEVYASTDWWEMSQVQLEVGSYATDFEQRPISIELALAQRYYQKTFPLATAPAQNAGNEGALGYRAVLAGVNNTMIEWAHPVRMRTSPTVTFYNPGASNSNWRNVDDVGDSGAPNVQIFSNESRTYIFNGQVSTDNVGESLYLHATADAEL